MLESRDLKHNWDKISVTVYYLGIIIVAFSLFFNKYFLEKYLQKPITYPIHIIQIIAFIIGFLFILAHVFNKQIKQELKTKKYTPNSFYLISIFFIFIIITLIIAFWQNPIVVEENGLFSKIGFIGYLAVTVLSFINFLLLKNKHYKNVKIFYEKEKNFWLIFSIAFLLLAIVDYTNIHETFQQWFLSITNIPFNPITMQIHALIPLTIALIAFFSFIFFFHALKEHKTMLPFFYTGIVIAIIAIIIDLFTIPTIQIYIEESLELLMPFLFIAASLIAIFDNL